MAIAKCRLDVWNPRIGGSDTNKWVTVQTPENRNAVVSVYFLDKLANPRNAEVVISNRAKNFAAANDDTFAYNYYDSNGTALPSGGTYTLQKNKGVLNDFFSDFQFVRLVDQYSNQVFFAGRVLSIKEGYDASKGQLLTLKVADALYELAKHPLKGISEYLTFTQSTHTVLDIVKAFIGILYKKDWLRLHSKTGISKTKTVYTDEAESNSVNVMAQLVADTIYTTAYNANIVTDDSGTPLRNRFVLEDATAIGLPSDRKVDLTKLKKSGLLGEILGILQSNPQGTHGDNEKFGWDYFVDPNISYGGHADFKGKNLDAATKPPPQMFNVFERGKRIYEINPAEYGLAVKYPAASNIVTQGHRTTVPASGSPVPQYATKPMSVGFDFTRPKEDLYSSVLLKYNDGGETKGENKKESGKGQEKELVMEIMYVTELDGHFKFNTLTSQSSFAVDSLNTSVDGHVIISGQDETEDSSGVTAAEWVSLYTNNNGSPGTLIRGQAARVQYQSHPTVEGSTVAYLILSHVCNEFLTQASGTYILKGRGNGYGQNATNVTCRINLGASVGNQGYPKRVWGLDKQKTMSKGVIKDIHVLRQEVASLLSRSSLEIVDGKFSISGPPMYHWDGEVRSTLNVTGGQQISLQNVGVHANGDTPGTAVELWRYGFREGMVIAKMNAGYTAIAQSGGKDVYGYCFGIPLDLSYQVNLTESQSFAAGDKVRFFIPLRAGDTIRVENILANVAGNHLITDLTFTEEPNQMTRLTTTGVNEGFGLGTVGFQASLAGMREESDIIMNVPKGHQIAVWTGLLSAVDTNTVQWQTVAGKAEVILADGTVYNIDTSTTNSNNTTDASGVDGESVRFGVATPPAAGDDTIYYIYVDPNTENVDKGEKNHLYTRPAGTPDTGSDPVYEQDGDNIIIGWMKAGATADDLAEFGVFRDSKPGEGKRNLAIVSHPGTATSALLKKGAQTFTTDLMIEASQWDNDDAYKEVKWHGGEKSAGDGTQDTTNATIKLADGTSRTIAYGGDSGDSGGGSYIYHNGTNYSQSPLTAFGVNNTYYAYIDFVINPTGNMILQWTNTATIPYGDDRVLLAMIVVPPNATKGRSPIIIPLTTKSLSINAVAIAANSITADHVAAGTISTTHIVAAGIDGSKLNIDSGTTFSSGYDPTDYSKTITTAATSYPSSPNNGDLFVKTNESNNLYRWNGSAWVLWDLGLARGTANTAVTNAATAQAAANTAQGTANSKRTTFTQSSTPSAISAGDVWINTSDQKIYMSSGTGTGSGSPPNNVWSLRDDAGAINNAATSINGGRINTQVIVLTSGGGKILEDGTENSGAGASRIVLSNTGITGYTSSSTSSFYMLASDGSARFGADIGGSGGGFIDKTGFYVNDSGGNKVSWMKGSAGLVSGEGLNSGIDFRNLHDNSLSISYLIISDRGGSSTYGGNSDAKVEHLVLGRDIIIQSVNQDIGLFPDVDSGKICMGDRPLVWLDTTEEDNTMHHSDTDYVGLWKRTGSAGTNNSTIYRLPWKNGTGGPTSSGNADKVLALVDNGSGSGTNTSPYLFDLKWVDQSGGGGSGDITQVNITAGTGLTGDVNTTSGAHTQTIDHLTAAGYKHIPSGGSSTQVLTYSSSGTATWQAASAHGTHGGGSGTVTSVSAGNGMVFTTITGSGPVHLGDPSSCSTGTSNATTSTSHTHQITGVMVSGDVSHATHLSNSITLTTTSTFADRFIVQSDASDVFYRIAASDIDLSTMNNDLVGWVDGSGTTNRMAYWTDSNTLAANSTSSTLVDIWVNDVRGIGGSPYCGITNNVFSKFMGVNLNLSGTDVKMTGLGTDSNNDATLLKIESNGTLVKSTSSRRYKENIVDLTIDTSKIFDLVPRSFKFKDQTIEVVNDETKETSYEIKVGKESFGLIAEEVNEYIPELVSLNSNGEPEAVDYVSISTLLITELKKLKARIEVLEEN